MSAEDQGWMVDDGPDVTDCDLGQHDWGDADECDDDCGDDRCSVTCRNCGLIDRACEDL